MNGEFISEIDGADAGPWTPLLKRMEQVFLELGFRVREIDGTRYMAYRENFCKITPLRYPNGAVKFVLEWADSRETAEKHLLEDGDLYSADLPETELLQQLRADLIREQKKLPSLDGRG